MTPSNSDDVTTMPFREHLSNGVETTLTPIIDGLNRDSRSSLGPKTVPVSTEVSRRYHECLTIPRRMRSIETDCEGTAHETQSVGCLAQSVNSQVDR